MLALPSTVHTLKESDRNLHLQGRFASSEVDCSTLVDMAHSATAGLESSDGSMTSSDSAIGDLDHDDAVCMPRRLPNGVSAMMPPQ